MKLKPLEVGDSVRVKYYIEVFYEEMEIYLDGKLIEVDNDDEYHQKWLVEYQLLPVMGAPKYQNWWHEDDITSTHYLPKTNDDEFDKAEKIAASDYTGMFFYDDHYFDELNEVLDHCECYGHEDPAFVWACDASPVKLTPDLVGMIMESLDEEGYEGLSERSQFHPLYEELRIVEEKIVAMAANEIVWNVNYKKAVIL